MLDETIPEERPVAEYRVGNAWEASAAVYSALESGYPVFDLYLREDSGLSYEAIREAAGAALSGDWSSLWMDPPGVLHIRADGQRDPGWHVSSGPKEQGKAHFSENLLLTENGKWL